MTPYINIEAKLNTFFLHNVSYCAAVKHRNPKESIFAFKSAGVDLTPTKDDATVLLIDDWIQNILSSSNQENVLLIYFYFVDKDTLQFLKNKTFSKVKFKAFESYFLLAQHELEKLPLSTGNFYRYVNFYHLIGTMRLLPSCDQNKISGKIISYLLDIIRSEMPLIIKFSARQILVNHYHSRLTHSDMVQIDLCNEQLLREVSDNSDLTKFLALYYLYYYDFSYEMNELVSDLRKKLSTLKDSELLPSLATNVPQLHSLMIRKGSPKKIMEKLTGLYNLSNNMSLSQDSVGKLLDEIVTENGEVC